MTELNLLSQMYQETRSHNVRLQNELREAREQAAKLAGALEVYASEMLEYRNNAITQWLQFRSPDGEWFNAPDVAREALAECKESSRAD